MEKYSSVPHFNVHNTNYAPLPQMGGHEAVLYQSEDKTRLAGSFKESGTHTMVMPFDEFIYVVEGSTKIDVQGGESIEMAAGDCCYLRQGLSVTFQHSDDFHDVTVLISDSPIDY